MNYKHLSQIERYQIYSLMKANQSITQIAEQLGRHKSTISREIGRNEGCRGYRPNQACELALARSQGSRNAREVKPWVMCQADVLLGLQWSPEQIAGKLPVSHETLYLHVYADKANGGKLWKNLRCQKQKRKRYAGGQDRRGQIPNRRPLSERPAHIEDRKQAIVTVVERGSNENFNGLLRQYVPKKRSMESITDEEIKMIENRLNNRPRKRLGFRTPAEVFHQSLRRVALRA